jgi:hypothetical protein
VKYNSPNSCSISSRVSSIPMLSTSLGFVGLPFSDLCSCPTYQESTYNVSNVYKIFTPVNIVIRREVYGVM